MKTNLDTALQQALQPLPDGVLKQAMAYALLGEGKRLRPMLCLLSAQLLGGSVAQAMPLAVAVECVHAYSLVHDDLPCMDDDALRRGRPTVHVVYGEAMALLAGDALLTLAFECAAASTVNVATAVRVLAQAAGGAGMVYGQALDITQPTHPQMRALKTGALIAAACVCGGLAAQASAHDIEQLQHFGALFGEAFQLRDDILDNEATATTSARVQMLSQQAMDVLTPYGDAAKPLQQLVQDMAKRSS